MAFHDCFELIDEQTYQGQKCLNVYFYQNNNVGAGGLTASDLVDDWIAGVLPKVKAMQETTLVHTRIRCRNLFDISDHHIRDISVAGTYSITDPYPIYVSIGFKETSDNGAVKNGSKRIAGIDETVAANGVVTLAGMLTNMTNFATQLAATIQHTAVNTWLPIIIKRLLVGGEYELPDNLGDAVIGAVVSAVGQTLLTTQNSRKIGVGE
jgi:hypothetical protein